MAALGTKGFEILETLHARDGGQPYRRLIAACRTGIDEEAIKTALSEYLDHQQAIATPAFDQMAVAALRAPTAGSDEAAIAALSWPYVSQLQQWGASIERAKAQAARLIALAGPQRVAHLGALFKKLSNFGCTREKKIEHLDGWIAKMERNPCFWPADRPDRTSVCNDRRDKCAALVKKVGGRITKKEMMRAGIPPGPMVRAGVIVAVGEGVYALPGLGVDTFVSASHKIVAALVAAPGHRMTRRELLATIGEIAIDRPMHTLRHGGILVDGERGVAELTPRTIATVNRGEAIRTRSGRRGGGIVLWSPPATARKVSA